MNRGKSFMMRPKDNKITYPVSIALLTCRFLLLLVYYAYATSISKWVLTCLLSLTLGQPLPPEPKAFMQFPRPCFVPSSRFIVLPERSEAPLVLSFIGCLLSFKGCLLPFKRCSRRRRYRHFSPSATTLSVDFAHEPPFFDSLAIECVTTHALYSVPELHAVVRTS